MRYLSVYIFFSVLVCGAVLARPVWAGPVRLNMELAAGGGVATFRSSPDSTRVVYIADQEMGGVHEIFSVPIEGGPAVKLNPELVSGGDVYGFQISPDGSRVVYRGEQDTDGVYEIYSVPVSRGAAVKLNAELPAGGMVWENAISPDGSRVVYRAEQEMDDVFELYSVPLEGGVPTRLNPELPTGGDVFAHFSFTPDSTRVVYKADQETDGVLELYSVPIAGGAAVKLNAGLTAGGGVTDHRISPDGSHVVYRADQETDEVYELYRVPPAGGTPVQLNGGLTAGGDVAYSSHISPDSSRVVYTADQMCDNMVEIYSVPITGGIPVQLNEALPAGGDVRGFRISSDSSRVVYTADQDMDGVVELFSVSITGGAAVKLNDALPAGGEVFDFSISSDGSRVVYTADGELFSVSITGGAAVKLNEPLAGGEDVTDFRISPDGSRVVYRADQEAVERYELFSVPIGGGTPVKLSGELTTGGDVSFLYAISDDSSRVLYRADQDTDDRFELYSQSLAPRLFFPHVGGGSWTTEIAVVNTHPTRPLNGTLMACNDSGEPVSPGESISLPAHGRREIDVGAYFPGATYAVFTAESFDHMCGYTKFSQHGTYRVAVPAVESLNRGTIYVPHIDAGSRWWTGLSLVNTTALPKTPTIVCNNGATLDFHLAPHGHLAFNFEEELGGVQPELKSAVIQDATGVIGLELFGHETMTQLSGVLLRDQASTTLYFPHVPDPDTWWTGICAYNPNEVEANLEITTYGGTGEVVSTAEESVPAAGRYIDVFSNMILSKKSEWFKIEADQPITGFELFGHNNNKMLAGYTAVNIRGKTGVFPKLEKEGWTGIAFVNTGSSTAVVTLSAYNEAGALIAEEPITVCRNCKDVRLAGDFFPESIADATYLAYASTEPVVGFQLNGSENGMMLDGLPGM
jgi:Tol biopolymer transport system component